MNDPTNSKQKWLDFVGTDWDQIEGLIEAGFCKINTDTENRQTFLSALLVRLMKPPQKLISVGMINNVQKHLQNHIFKN